MNIRRFSYGLLLTFGRCDPSPLAATIRPRRRPPPPHAAARGPRGAVGRGDPAAPAEGGSRPRRPPASPPRRSSRASSSRSSAVTSRTPLPPTRKTVAGEDRQGRQEVRRCDGEDQGLAKATTPREHGRHVRPGTSRASRSTRSTTRSQAAPTTGADTSSSARTTDQEGHEGPARSTSRSADDNTFSMKDPSPPAARARQRLVFKRQ